jgi:RNA recognition motif-containing protein
MRRAQNELTLSAPEDKTITTLYVGGVPVESGEQDVRDAFYQYGEIKIIKMLPKQRCSFVVFQHREAAELAAERCFKALKIGGKMVRIQWAEKADGGDTVAKKQALALMEKEDHSKKDPLAKQEAMAAYPSQNTWNQGNAPLQREEDAERLAAAAGADPLAPVGHDGKGYGSMAAGFTATNGARAGPYDNVADANGKGKKGEGKKGKGKKGKAQISGRGLAGAR